MYTAIILRGTTGPSRQIGASPVGVFSGLI